MWCRSHSDVKALSLQSNGSISTRSLQLFIAPKTFQHFLRAFLFLSFSLTFPLSHPPPLFFPLYCVFQNCVMPYKMIYILYFATFKLLNNVFSVFYIFQNPSCFTLPTCLTSSISRTSAYYVDILITRISVISVSYTHLDVYKRQVG